MKRITECSIRKILTILPVFTSIWEFFVEFRASTLSYDFTRIIQSSSRDRDRVASRTTSDDRIVTILCYDVYVSSTEIRMVKKRKKWKEMRNKSLLILMGKANSNIRVESKWIKIVFQGIWTSGTIIEPRLTGLITLLCFSMDFFLFERTFLVIVSWLISYYTRVYASIVF